MRLASLGAARQEVDEREKESADRQDGKRHLPGFPEQRRSAADPLRALQARPASYKSYSDRAKSAARFALRLPAHHRGASPGIGGRRQRHQGLARPSQPRHHQSLCRNQHQDETGSARSLPATFDFFGGASEKTSLAKRTKTARMARDPLSDMWPSAAARCPFRGGAPHNGGGHKILIGLTRFAEVARCHAVRLGLPSREAPMVARMDRLLAACPSDKGASYEYPSATHD